MNTKNTLRFTALAALVGTALTFSACGDDDGGGNPEPSDGSGGSSSSGGSKSSGGASSGGASSGGASSGGASEADAASGGSSGSGGKGSGGSGTGGTVPEGGCEGPEGCFACDPIDGDNSTFLNRCTDGDCIPYTNADVPAEKDLPPLP